MNFGCVATLKKHLDSCNGVWEEPTIAAKLPSTMKPYHKDTNKTHVFFQNWWQTIFHENVVYADIETFFSEATMEVSSNTKAYGENNSIASIAKA